MSRRGLAYRVTAVDGTSTAVRQLVHRAVAPDARRRGLSPLAQQALFTLPAFRGLPEAERERIAPLFAEIALPKGETIYSAGEEADALYLVISGAVDVMARGATIARYGPGEVFGEAVLVPGERRLVTTCVAFDAVLLVLGRDELEALLGVHPELRERVSGLVARRLTQAVGLVHPERTPPTNVVFLEGWSSDVERRRLVGALAGAIESELQRPISILTVSAQPGPTIARRDRPDVVISTDRPSGALRERVATEVAARAAHAPVVLVDVDRNVAGQAELADDANTILVRFDGHPPTVADADPRRVAFVRDGPENARPALSANRTFVLPVDVVTRARTLARLARYVTRRSVGIALGSGAAWGLAHIGVLEVLERARVPIDAVAGASMGAIVGAHYALGFPPERLEEIATSVRHIADLFRIMPRLLYLGADFNIVRPGLFAGAHFQRVLESLGPIKGRTFKHLTIPFRAVAADVASGARVEIADGELSDAMRASFSAPWIFSPFRIGEHVLVDGGMTDPVPAETVRSMGVDLVIGVNVVPPLYPEAKNPLETLLRALAKMNPMRGGNGGHLPNSFEVVVRILQMMQHELGNSRAGEADVLVNPDLRGFWVLEFWNAAAIIDRGRRAAEAGLPAIRAKIDELRREAT
jgi:NTE family protein